MTVCGQNASLAFRLQTGISFSTDSPLLFATMTALQVFFQEHLSLPAKDQVSIVPDRALSHSESATTVLLVQQLSLSREQSHPPLLRRYSLIAHHHEAKYPRHHRLYMQNKQLDRWSNEGTVKVSSVAPAAKQVHQKSLPPPPFGQSYSNYSRAQHCNSLVSNLSLQMRCSVPEPLKSQDDESIPTRGHDSPPILPRRRLQ